MRYGTILYELRDQWGLSNTEMLLIDAISKLQAASVSKPGWCDAGASYLTWVCGVDRTNFFRMQKRLFEKGFLEIMDGGFRRVPQSIVYQLFMKTPASGSGETPLGQTGSGETPLTSGETPLQVVAKRHSSSGETPLYNTDNTMYNTAAAAARKIPSVSKPKAKRTQPPPIPPAPPRDFVSFEDSGWMQKGIDSFRDALVLRFGDLANVDVGYYFNRCIKWSSGKSSGKSSDWIQTASEFMRGDADQGKLKSISVSNSNQNTSNVNGISASTSTKRIKRITADELAAQTASFLKSREGRTRFDRNS